jgi:hypothetical protein
VAAHRLEAPIVGPLLAHEDAIHGRLHVVVDADLGCALEKGKRPVVGIDTISCASRGYARTNSMRL